jgi:S-formylglutathione hydrolase
MAEVGSSLPIAKTPYPDAILVDQGLLDTQFHPDALEKAAKIGGQVLKLRRHAHYDHSYWFIQSFVAEHMKWHAEKLNANGERIVDEGCQKDQETERPKGEPG